VTSRNSRLIIAVAALVGLVAAYWFLVLGPKRDQIAKLDADIATKQTELSTAQSTLGEYRKARDGYSDNYATLVRLGKAVPEQDDTRSLLVQLDSAAKSSGVDFRTMSVGGSSSGPATTGTAAGPVVPGAVVGTAGFSVLPLTFSFRGSFFDMSQFFSRLERFVTVDNSKVNVTGRLVRVESVTVKPDQLGFPHLRAEIGASSYLVPSDQGLTGGATAAGPAAAGSQTAPSDGGSTPPTTTATATGVTP
jgi:Tfp pilus assembly protein PilO